MFVFFVKDKTNKYRSQIYPQFLNLQKINIEVP
ncbi:MAG: hypothetical protein ACJAT4_000162 [Granulosicoccus sp.]|jgi:hypothetical protein